MPTFSIHGLAGADRPAPYVSEYEKYRFPEHITVPKQFGGKGGDTPVRSIFEGAFAILSGCAGRKGCDTAFAALGAGLTLSGLLKDWSFYFYLFAPTASEKGKWPDSDANLTLAEKLGSYPDKRFAEIALHLCALRDAAYLAGSLLHEFAHIAGAPGASAADYAAHAAGKLPEADFRRLHQAEHCVRLCGLTGNHKRNVIGALDRQRAGRYGLA